MGLLCLRGAFENWMILAKFGHPDYVEGLVDRVFKEGGGKDGRR